MRSPVSTGAAAASVERAEPGRLDVVSLSRLRRTFLLLDRATLVTHRGHVLGTFYPADTLPPLTPDEVHALGVEPYEAHEDPAIELLRLAAEVASVAVEVEDARGRPADNSRLRAFQARRLAYVLAAKGPQSEEGDA